EGQALGPNTDRTLGSPRIDLSVLLGLGAGQGQVQGCEGQDLGQGFGQGMTHGCVGGIVSRGGGLLQEPSSPRTSEMDVRLTEGRVIVDSGTSRPEPHLVRSEPVLGLPRGQGQERGLGGGVGFGSRNSNWTAEVASRNRIDSLTGTSHVSLSAMEVEGDMAQQVYNLQSAEHQTQNGPNPGTGPKSHQEPGPGSGQGSSTGPGVGTTGLCSFPTSKPRGSGIGQALAPTVAGEARGRTQGNAQRKDLMSKGCPEGGGIGHGRNGGTVSTGNGMLSWLPPGAVGMVAQPSTTHVGAVATSGAMGGTMAGRTRGQVVAGGNSGMSTTMSKLPSSHSELHAGEHRMQELAGVTGPGAGGGVTGGTG
ncbi:unnamed protein product, partial [Choristocarpus tenellus]